MSTILTNSRLGDDLIFIFSQPRAGSTMLQRILGSHPAVHTVGEPWVMLAPFYALRPDGDERDKYWGTDVHAALVKIALESFIGELPAGDETYYEGVRRMYSYLYGSAREQSGKQFFLDKTPLYFYVIPQIQRTFPRAKFLFLLRNPLAVLNSMIDTFVWDRDDPNWLLLIKGELLAAPHLLLEGMQKLTDNCHVIHYEQLVAAPVPVLTRACQWLGIPFLPEIVEYGRSALPRFSKGDRENVYRHSRPDPAHVDHWQTRLGSRQRWRLTRDYLQILGPDTIQRMGYSFQELEAVIHRYQPRRFSLHPTVSLASYLGNRNWRQSLWSFYVRLDQKLQTDGIRAAGGAVARRIVAPFQRQASYCNSDHK